MNLFTDSSRGRSFAKDPSVVYWQGSYWLFYSIPPWGDGRANDGWRIGIARGNKISEFSSWRKVGEIHPEAGCEAKGLCAPGAIVLDGDLFVFYQTYGNGPRDAICVARTTDGEHFERHPANPIVRARGDWNSGRAIDAEAFVVENRLMLHFATRDPAGKIQMLGAASTALSVDWKHDFAPESWRPEDKSGPILKPELPWEKDCIEAATVLKRDGKYFLFYAGAYNNAPQQIGGAVSKDGVNFSRLSQHPLLANGAPGTWNSSESGHPGVFTDRDGSTHLFFQGNPDGGKTWFLAHARIEWTGDLPRIEMD
jgi:predicted GH43/DUF377 family glycosyl hydrolase